MLELKERSKFENYLKQIENVMIVQQCKDNVSQTKIPKKHSKRTYINQIQSRSL